MEPRVETCRNSFKRKDSGASRAVT
jgi:hypothetical protein